MNGQTLAKVLLVLSLLFRSEAWASVSLLTGAVLVGADRLPSTGREARALDDVVRDFGLRAGLVCLVREHHRYESGLTYSRAMLLKSSLESYRWEVEELTPLSTLTGRMGLWLARRGREQVLVFLFPLEGVGYVSFCQVR